MIFIKDILKVEICISDIGVEKKIVLKNTNVMTDNKEKIISEELYSRLFNIIYRWKPNLRNNNIIDGEEYSIKIYTNNGVEVFKGKGKYPKNYSDFIDWFGEVYE